MSEYKPIETVKHSFVTRDNDESGYTAIRIDEGKFKGVIYGYSEVEAKETPEGSLSLDFTILNIKSENDNHTIYKEEFEKICGDILVSCLEKSLAKEEDFEIIYRDYNSESPTEQRELQSKSITIPED